MKILKVVPLADRWIVVHFDDNQSLTIDMKRKLHTIRFGELRQEEVFNAVETDGKSVRWPRGVSVSISEIFEMASK